MTITRREALRLAAAAAAAPLLPPPPQAAAAAALFGPAAPTVAAGRFFSAPEMALLDELTEMIIPTDERSGGARAAGVTAYIDGRLADYDPELPVLREERERWRAGLFAVDAIAREATSKPFLESTPAERLAVLQRMATPPTGLPTEEPAENRKPQTDKPETVGQRFFIELKSWTARGYYTSKVGIHDEMQYKGNVLQAEFSGIDVATLPPVRPRE